jgi:hypothetical protein
VDFANIPDRARLRTFSSPGRTRMPRPHIDYLQSQTLPWQASHWPYLPGCQIKILSRDPDGGAVSLLVRYPSGWAAPAPGCLAAVEELFVLEGLLELDGRAYRQDCYGRFPAGWKHATRLAPEGAVVLAFYDADPGCSADQPPAVRPAADGTLVDAFELTWNAKGLDRLFGGNGQLWKVLHGSPAAGSCTMLIASAPHLHPPRWVAPQEIHSCAEEMFLLSGDFLCNVGQMASGAYCWRPPGIAHGPYGSRGGNLALLRTHGAPLATEFTAHEIALQRNPGYQPILPPRMRAVTTHPWRPQRY